MPKVDLGNSMEEASSLAVIKVMISCNFWLEQLLRH